MDSHHGQLIAQATAGDRDALCDLLDEVGASIAKQMAGEINPQWQSILDIEDVMQVTFVEAFLDIERFGGDDLVAFQAWLRRIARNNLNDAIRGLKSEKRPPPSRRVQSPPQEESYITLIEQLGAITTSVASKAALREIVTYLDRALQKLPEDYQTVLRLYDLEGMSGPEVAAQMGRRRGAVHMLRSRALVRLREHLGPESQYFTFVREPGELPDE